MKRVLFVDDEPNVLMGLKRMLHALRSEWEMSFVASGAEALETMEKSSFDVVVSDIRMPGMDGVELLSRVKERHPQTVRIVLSGHADRDVILRSVVHVHQFLAKPCASHDIKTTVQRALTLRDLLTSERLARITSKFTALPAVPALYLEIQELLGKGGSIEQIGRLVARDVGLSAKVLQLVNSAFFGVPQRFTSAATATVYLGIDTLTALVLGSQLFSDMNGLGAETLEQLWTHSLRTGSMARAIAKLEGLPRGDTELAFVAGMLHEIGILVLASETRAELTHAWQAAKKLGIPTSEAERRFMGASHAAVGAYLLGLWGLPDAVIEAIAFHHTPAELPHDGFSLVTAVHVATNLDAGQDGSAIGQFSRELDGAYLERQGLSARLPTWQEAWSAACTAGEAA